MSTLCDQDIADKAQQLMNGTGMHSLVLKETEGKILSIVIIIIAITLPAFSVVVWGLLETIFILEHLAAQK